EDLFYRINVIHLAVPPLRERREDIPLLIDYFLNRFIHQNGSTNGNGNGHSPVRALAPEAVTALSEYAWPGNVRQVENVVERLVVTGRREIVQAEDLPHEIRTVGPEDHRHSRERRRTVADDLFKKLVTDRESFWTAVYPLYMSREITKSNVRDLVHMGLEEAR